MNIELREWNSEDATQLVNIVNNTDRTYLRCLGGGKYSLKDARKYIRLVTGEKAKYGLFRAIVVDGEVVGVISVELGGDITAIDASIGYYLHNDYMNKGIATEAVRLIVAEAMKSLDITRITAYIAEPNSASMCVLEKKWFQARGHNATGCKARMWHSRCCTLLYPS